MDLFINSAGAKLKTKKNLFLLINNETKTEISPKNINKIIIANNISITSNVIKLAMDNDIDVIFYNNHYFPYARVWNNRFGSTAEIRKKQLILFDAVYGTNIIKKWITNKINSQINHLNKIAKDNKQVLNNISEIIKYKNLINNLQGDINELRSTIMGYEGITSRLYYDSISILLPERYKFNGRSSHPAKDEYNVCLNYQFGILYSYVEKALINAGLDPFIGILHTDFYAKKSLLFDFIENYRFIVWESVFSLFKSKLILKKYFITENDGIKITDEGKNIIIEAFYKKFNSKIKIDKNNYQISYIIERDAQNLAQDLLNQDLLNKNI
ncbi:MAG: CRISP-associated protein Cas1 [Fusobacteriaceae bacterium]|nr:CRISPR-associated endonuclease Cas1 [Fusobacteriales bacterium]MDN5304812.1 CRISP-associated protein Cas1 [Fusobacteriaceae bacterium]